MNDANALVAAFRDAELEEPAASAVALLALVAGQDVEPAEGSDGTDGRWRIARKVAEDRVISVHDPDARHTRKSPENRRDGYRAHVAACPETGIITGGQLTRAAGEDNSDAAVAARLLAAKTHPPRSTVTRPTAPGTCAQRSGRPGTRRSSSPSRSSPPLRADSPWMTSPSMRPPEPSTCPAGITRPVTARRNVTFGAACRGCPLRARCTTSKHGRALILHQHDALLRAARHDWATSPKRREDYRKYRPDIERVISQVATRGGRRLKLRYAGTARNNAWLKNRAAALNLRNLIGRGLARGNGAWVLA